MSTPNAPNQLSFLPEDYLDRKARRRANILCGALSVVVLGAIGTVFATSERSMRGVEAQHAEVDARYTQAARQIEQVQLMHGKQRQIVQHAELAAALVERVPRSNILAEFTNALPPGASLMELLMEAKPRQAPAPAAGTAFDQKKAAMEAAAAKAKAGPAEAPPIDVYIRLTGMADNDLQVSQFMTRLGTSKLLKDVSLVISESFQHDKATVRRFQIEMMLNPDAEVREPPTAVKVAALEGEEVGK